MDKFYAIAMIAVIALVTAALRFLPFFIPRRNERKFYENENQFLPALYGKGRRVGSYGIGAYAL